MIDDSMPQGLDGPTLKAVVSAVSTWVSTCEATVPGCKTSEGMDWKLLDRILEGEEFRTDVLALVERNGMLLRAGPGFGQAQRGWLPDEFIPAVKRAVREYLRVLGASENHVPPFYIDVEHSALLRRLLGGKSAMKEAPPIAYSHPWYALLEEAGPLECDVTVFETGDPADHRLAINQSLWEVLEKVSDGEYIVRWRGKKRRYRITKNQADPRADAFLIEEIN